MNKKKKTAWTILGILAVIFICYNLFWFIWRNARYDDYIQNLSALEKRGSYAIKAEDGYVYNVKLPDYLHFTGNLCAASPDDKCALLIWPEAFGGYEYGVQINVGEVGYSIMLDKNRNVVDPRFEGLVTEYQEDITDLYLRAEKMWQL